MTRIWVRALSVALLIAASIAFFLLFPEFVTDFRAWMTLNRDFAIASFVMLLLFFGFTQLLIIPSGSAILLITGAVIGPISGLLYFAAMLGVSPLVYFIGTSQPKVAQDALSRLRKEHAGQKLLANVLKGMQNKPIGGMGALRLLPVVPSAPAVLVAAALGLSLRGVLIGTAFFGFIRPMAISTIGYSVGMVSLTSDKYPDLAIILIMLVGLSSLAASIGLLRYLVRSTASQKLATKI